MVRVCLRLSRFASHGYDESDSVVKLPGGMVVTHELMPGQPVPSGMAGHDKLRLSREILPVKRKPEPHPVQNAPDHFLR